MYGTIATMRVKPGKEQELEHLLEDGARETPGFRFAHVYRMDDDPQTLMLAVAFDDRASYHANAESPRQHEEYLACMKLLEGDPEWHDGEIVSSSILPNGDH